MLLVNYYNDNVELKNLLQNSPVNAQVVCPSPEIADAIREMLASRFEIITIARWIKDIKIPKGSQKVGKSELMLHLASAFKKYYPNYSENIFFHGFELFTELRSFTLNISIMAGILEELDENIKNTIKLFWAVLDSQLLVDEHLLYTLMGEIFIERPIVILGFKHLSAIQIDMLKKIAQETDIYIYIPAEVKLNAISIDWVNWIDTHKVLKNELRQRTNLNLCVFSKNKLNFYLQSFKKLNGAFDICLLGSTYTLNEIQEIATDEFQFKVKVDIFNIEKKKIFEQLKADKILSIEKLIENAKINVAQCFARQDFVSGKIWQLVVSSCEIYREYSPVLDGFFFVVLEQIVELNSPRNYFVSLNNYNRNKVLSFETLKFNNSQNPIAVTLSKDSSLFSNTDTHFPDSIKKLLKTIGPLKRGGLDSLFAKFELREVLKNPNAILFVEEGVLETSVGLKEVLSSFNLISIDHQVQFQPKKQLDVFSKLIKIKKHEMTSYSASKLQSYYDCPRKYYINFIEKHDERPIEKVGIALDEVGSLEHSIIEVYFDENNILDESILMKLCKDKLYNFINSHKILIDFNEVDEVLYELIEYTGNGLTYLYSIKKSIPDAKFTFEVPLPKNEFGINGNIDCLVETSLGTFIYDFKRSASSIGTRKSLLSYEKLQLWIYYLVMKDHKNITQIGYINISDIGGNLIIKLENHEAVMAFDLILKDLISNLQINQNFYPNPRNENSCMYCSVELICPKEYLNE